MRAYLEHFPEQGGPARRVEITKSPFLIGRSPNSRPDDLLPQGVQGSRRYRSGCRQDVVRDLNSTNGTFVNGRRIDEVPLVDGDIIHVTHWEFCFCSGPAVGPPSTIRRR